MGFKGYGLTPDVVDVTAPFIFEGREYTLRHGSVVLAAITSCTNTSNPSVMLGAGKTRRDRVRTLAAAMLLLYLRDEDFSFVDFMANPVTVILIFPLL